MSDEWESGELGRDERYVGVIDERDDHIAKLTADLAACEKMKLGYYGEAQEGWSKFREAERELARLRSLLTEVRGCQRLWIEPNAISVTIPRDLWKRLK